MLSISESLLDIEYTFLFFFKHFKTHITHFTLVPWECIYLLHFMKWISSTPVTVEWILLVTKLIKQKGASYLESQKLVLVSCIQNNIFHQSFLKFKKKDTFFLLRALFFIFKFIFDNESNKYFNTKMSKGTFLTANFVDERQEVCYFVNQRKGRQGVTSCWNCLGKTLVTFFLVQVNFFFLFTPIGFLQLCLCPIYFGGAGGCTIP